jgi:hypothetical protein
VLAARPSDRPIAHPIEVARRTQWPLVAPLPSSSPLTDWYLARLAPMCDGQVGIQA